MAWSTGRGLRSDCERQFGTISRIQHHNGGTPRCHNRVPEESRAIFEPYRALIDDWDRFQSAISRPLPNCIWANPLRIDPDPLRRSLRVDGVELSPIPWHAGAFRLPPDLSPGRPWQYRAGLYHVQEEASMIPASCVSIRPGDRILDLCAAPGNKTAQIAVALADTGLVVANDRNRGRTRGLRHTIERLGLVNVAVTVGDGKRFPSPEPGELFDGVLVDAPCSCEGTIRRGGQSRSVGTQEIEAIAEVQTILLRRAVKLVRPGGWVVYSTCTFSPLENECVVEAAVGLRRSEMDIEQVSIPGLQAAPGLREWEGRVFSPGMEHCLRIWPHLNDTGGFFVAVLRRRKDGTDSEPSTRSNPVSKRGPESTVLTANPDLAGALDRFGIPSSAFEDWVSPMSPKGKVYAAPPDSVAPAQPKADSHGLLALHTKLRFPKLTTGAAMRWGRLATRNVIELNVDQRDRYLRRETSRLTADQVEGVTGLGYVVVSFQGQPLGIGFFEQETEGPRVSSMYPRGWVV